MIVRRLGQRPARQRGHLPRRSGYWVTMRVVSWVPEVFGQTVGLARCKDVLDRFGAVVPFHFRVPGLIRQVPFPQPVCPQDVKGILSSARRELNLTGLVFDQAVFLHQREQSGNPIQRNGQRAGEALQARFQARQLELVEVLEGVLDQDSLRRPPGFTPAGREPRARPEEQGRQGGWYGGGQAGRGEVGGVGGGRGRGGGGRLPGGGAAASAPAGSREGGRRGDGTPPSRSWP